MTLPTLPEEAWYDIGGWRSRAACKDVDPELFFAELIPPSPQMGLSVEEAEGSAKMICATCPVEEECLTYALRSNQERGVWGGMTWRERRALRRGEVIPTGYQLQITPQGLTVARVDVTAVRTLQPRIHRLIEALAIAPQEMVKLHPREFEYLVAELLERGGYEVEVTRGTRDGGVDIFASRSTDLGADLLFLVQCKRYSHPNRVGVGAVRELVGVVHSCQAWGGAIVTSSFFTKDARSFADRFPHQITLRDNLALQEWIQRAVTK
jgi:HJR/Mrr/RecB family endonuclease